MILLTNSTELDQRQIFDNDGIDDANRGFFAPGKSVTTFDLKILFSTTPWSYWYSGIALLV